MLTTVVEKIKAKFPSSLLEVKEFRDETTLHIKKEDIVLVCTFLRDDEDCRFDYLSDLCGADAYTPENRFEVVYNLYSLQNKQRLRLKVFTDESDLACAERDVCLAGRRMAGAGSVRHVRHHF